MNAGGEGSIARRSRLTAPTPASAAASASAPSSAVLPTPPGPWIHNTLNGGSGAASAPRNSSSSAARPTNRRRRALFKRSATVDAGGGSYESCRAIGHIVCPSQPNAISAVAHAPGTWPNARGAVRA